MTTNAFFRFLGLKMREKTQKNAMRLRSVFHKKRKKKRKMREKTHKKRIKTHKITNYLKELFYGVIL